MRDGNGTWKLILIKVYIQDKGIKQDRTYLKKTQNNTYFIYNRLTIYFIYLEIVGHSVLLES